MKDIISETSIEMDEAETVVKNLVDKGIAKEIEEEGKNKYDFSVCTERKRKQYPKVRFLEVP
ncbi:MAG: hypothetical protein LBQ44_08850 [Treponema sp.]|nr:hypothetical protein [Treponema sp.]